MRANFESAEQSEFEKQGVLLAESILAMGLLTTTSSSLGDSVHVVSVSPVPRMKVVVVVGVVASAGVAMMVHAFDFFPVATGKSV